MPRWTARLLRGDTGLEPTHDRQNIPIAKRSARRGAFRVGGISGPKHAGIVGDVVETCGHDSDDEGGFVAELGGLTDDVGRRAVERYPEFVAQNHDAMAGKLIFCSKVAAEGRFHAERGEQIRGDTSTLDDLCPVPVRLTEEPGLGIIGRERFKGMVLALPVEEIGVRAYLWVACARRSGTGGKFHGSNRDESIDFGKRQWTQKNAVDEAEDGGGSSDAEREREGDGNGEARTAAKLADGEGEILSERRRHL